MRILITGGAGFIGCNFSRYLLENHPDLELVVMDNLSYAGRLENLGDILDRIHFIRGDICNAEDLNRIKHCDMVFNFAASTHVDRSIQDPSEFLRTNYFGTYMLLEHLRRYDWGRLVQISTDEVYGSISDGCFKESDPLNPSSPYSATKAGADLLCLSYFKTYGLDIVITRSSNNYGPYQYPEKLIPLLIIRALRDQPLPIYGDGSNIRDWIYVLDNCRAISLAGFKGGRGQIYNISSGEEFRNLDVAKMILDYLGKPYDLITYVKDRPGHDYRYSLDTSKIRGLGWAPSTNFREGLRKTIDWYLSNRWWWEPLV